MTRRTRKVLCAAIASALLCIASFNPARAQAPADDEGPIIIGQRRQFERFYLDRPEIALDLTNIYQRDSNTSGDSTTTSDQFFFQQLLELRTQGYVLSPNLFTLSLYGAGGVSESFVRVEDEATADSSDNIGAIYEWDVEGTYQPNGDTPLTLYSRREQNWVFREFGPALESITTDTGAELELRSTKAPTRFSVSHLESTQSGLQDIDDFSYTRDAFTWYTTYLPTENQTVNWDYTFAAVDQEGVTDQQYQTHDATLAHEVVFGQRRRHSLNSSLSYYQQTGDLDVQRFRWDERLRMQHTGDFRTRVDYTYDQTDVGGLDRNRHRASAGFTHDLFDSLVTGGNVGAQRSEAGDSTALETFADINWSYRKHVPLGVLSANLGLAWSRQDSDAQTDPIQVIDQPAVFGDALPIVITGTNVNPSTLAITDPSGLILYQEGLDYTVTQFADRIEIDRIVGGRIGAGQAALLDYQLAPLPGAISTSTSLNTGLRYDFDQGPLRGLTLYGRYARAHQDIESETPSAFVPNEFTDIAYGVEYRIGNLTLGAEHQDHDSTINPFEADRFFARYNQRIRGNTLLGLNASYTSIQYFKPENQLDLFTVSGQLVHQFTPRLSGSLTVLYRNEQDDLHGQTTGFEQHLELRWRHRQTQVYAVLRNAQLENPDQDQSFQFFQLGIRREF